jgi:hypothetical protein
MWRKLKKRVDQAFAESRHAALFIGLVALGVEHSGETIT